jgi:lipopolysaccharide/colanic/teichoic acid biosynthesis glycosyltransferase
VNDQDIISEPVKVDWLKALFDKVISAVGLVLLSPIFVLAAMVILVDGLIWSEDRGPIFHRETRISAGHSFALYKFRTMQIGAVEQVQRQGLTIKHLERENRGHTRAGWYLRRWYWDELPQLINIWRGEMSLVGPRPPAPTEYERELSEGNVRKQLTRAGLVGLQQVYKGRSQGFEEEIALDYAYVARVRRMSPLRRLIYDIGIILRSIRVLWEREGL